MLSLSLPMRGGGSGDYYLKLAQQDYYTKSLGPPGEWFGKGAEELRLRGRVEAVPLKNLLEGKSPDGTKTLVQIQEWKDRERQSGWDMTFSAPKSVSVLWSQSSQKVRARIEAAHRTAVKKALTFLEKEAGITRRGQGGKVWERAKVVFALFQHGTSRANDPQLHTHAVLVNLSIREDGTTGALRSKGFFDNKMAAGAMYQLELASQLRQEMNLQVVPEKVAFRVEGVPQDLCRQFSTRRRHIEKVIQKEGDHSAEFAKIAAVLTRPSKNEEPAEVLFSKWVRVGESFGWGPEQAKRLVEEALHQEQPKKRARTSIDEKTIISLLKQAKEQEQEERRERAQNQSGAGNQRGAGNSQRAGQNEQSQNKGDFTNQFEEAREKSRSKPYFRFESRLLFPRAPLWSPFKNWRIAVPVLGENKPKGWWGKVRWKVETPLGQLQWRDKYLFPNAPEWSPLKHFAIPRLVLRQDTEWKWRENLWKKNTTFGQLQLRWKALFPHAAEDSLAHKMAIPAFRLQTKRPDYKNEQMTKQTHSH
jgi:conjugative relaxase-like TrwC/TraI family protein